MIENGGNRVIEALFPSFDLCVEFSRQVLALDNAITVDYYHDRSALVRESEFNRIVHIAEKLGAQCEFHSAEEAQPELTKMPTYEERRDSWRQYIKGIKEHNI